MAHINLIVAASNIAGLPAIRAAWNFHPAVGALVTATVGASTLMHLSETKHQLPGVVLVRHSQLLLNVDRVMALASSILAVVLYARNPNVETLLTDALGMACLVVSETADIGNGKFAALHSTWHVLAYMRLWALLSVEVMKK